ncbi:MAG: hypothetical protein GX160_09115 [Clostridiales bacterium]|nr:hypothetical protein [Clostridiales bacterium]
MGILFNAFILSDITGVEINGITIRNYSISGVLIDYGSGNRIVNNKIYNAADYGIHVSSSSYNLIWKNEICSGLMACI